MVFEEIPAPKPEEYIEPLFNDESREPYVYMCEFEDCGNPATCEWMYADEEERAGGEGFLYATMRCDNHPETDPDYHRREL